MTYSRVTFKNNQEILFNTMAKKIHIQNLLKTKCFGDNAPAIDKIDLIDNDGNCANLSQIFCFYIISRFNSNFGICL